jgi:hypothetical protein
MKDRQNIEFTTKGGYVVSLENQPDASFLISIRNPALNQHIVYIMKNRQFAEEFLAEIITAIPKDYSACDINAVITERNRTIQNRCHNKNGRYCTFDDNGNCPVDCGVYAKTRNF